MVPKLPGRHPQRFGVPFKDFAGMARVNVCDANAMPTWSGARPPTMVPLIENRLSREILLPAKILNSQVLG
jgi:hypothetical protein